MAVVCPMPKTVLGGLLLFVVTVLSEVSRHLMLNPNPYQALPQASAQLLNIVLTQVQSPTYCVFGKPSTTVFNARKKGTETLGILKKRNELRTNSTN